MYFTFEDHIFRQTKGLPVSSTISGVLAKTVHGQIEKHRAFLAPIYQSKQAICLPPNSLRRNGKRISPYHPRLKFEIEKPTTLPDGLSLSLHFKVTIPKNGKSSFKVYKKSAKEPLIVLQQPALSRNSKINFTRNERKRIQQRCSTQTASEKHNRSFSDILRLNGYPENLMS